ncbi:hypothetical protein BC833DRAFT_607881 [Globomyces pollinis-pini]|nr:hypothetical protein BC833DRAFT_607881 [Globomyces pollinis-pini]
MLAVTLCTSLIQVITVVINLKADQAWAKDILHPLQQTMQCQLPPLKKLAQNLQKHGDAFDSEPLRCCLDAHLQVITTIGNLVADVQAQNKFWYILILIHHRQMLTSSRNKTHLKNLFYNFQLTSDGLQLGLQVDKNLISALDAKIQNVPTSTDSVDSDLQKSLVNIESKVNTFEKSVLASKAMAQTPETKLRDYYLRAYDLFYAKLPDYFAAFSLFQLSKELPESKYFLGVCYQYGYGTEPNHQKAKAYLENAWTNSQFPTALLELGRLNDHQGNSVEAFRHYLVAGALGIPRACEKLAYMYETGVVIKNDAEAAYWRAKAADYRY